MIPVIDLAAILVTGLMIGNELAVAALIHPALYHLDARCHAASASRIAHALGRAMPFWYALGLVTLVADLFAHRSAAGTTDLRLLVAALIWAFTIVFTVVALVPINNRISRLNPSNPHPTWIEDRRRWDTLHRIRVAVLTIAFLLLLLGVLRPR